MQSWYDGTASDYETKEFQGVSTAPRVTVIIPAYRRPEVTSQYRLPPGAKLVCGETRSGGPAEPRNIGVGMARGEYMAFLDQDDVWLPEKLETQVALLTRPPVWSTAISSE